MLLMLSTCLNSGTRQAMAVSIGLALARALHVLLGLKLGCIGFGFDLVYSVMGKQVSAFTATRKGVQNRQNWVVPGLLAVMGLQVGWA